MPLCQSLPIHTDRVFWRNRGRGSRSQNAAEKAVGAPELDRREQSCPASILEDLLCAVLAHQMCGLTALFCAETCGAPRLETSLDPILDRREQSCPASILEDLLCAVLAHQMCGLTALFCAETCGAPRLETSLDPLLPASGRAVPSLSSRRVPGCSR